MGPLDSLLAWGATVVAVDLKRPTIWQRLVAKARHSAGTLLFPLRVPFSAGMSDDELVANAGVDLLSETPEIIAWLRTFDGPVTVGGYADLDGQMHVRVVLAMDSIMVALVAGRFCQPFSARNCRPTRLARSPKPGALRLISDSINQLRPSVQQK